MVGSSPEQAARTRPADRSRARCDAWRTPRIGRTSPVVGAFVGTQPTAPGPALPRPRCRRQYQAIGSRGVPFSRTSKCRCGSGGLAGGPDLADLLAGRHDLPGADQQARLVGVQGRQPPAVVDHHGLAVAAPPARRDDPARGRGDDGLAARGGDVDTAVQAARAEDRMGAVPVAGPGATVGGPQQAAGSRGRGLPPRLRQLLGQAGGLRLVGGDELGVAGQVGLEPDERGGPARPAARRPAGSAHAGPRSPARRRDVHARRRPARWPACPAARRRCAAARRRCGSRR